MGLVNRIDFLDSARGIAAIIVLIFHVNTFVFYNMISEISRNYLLNTKLQYLLSIVFNGLSAVSFFFVLSGFVLSLYYFKQNKSVDLTPFYIKRIFRIFPLYVFLVIIAFFLNNENTTIYSLVKELMILPNEHILLPPGWSMTVELSISLLVPFIIIMIQKQKNLILPLFLVLLLISKYISPYLIHFLIGSFLASFFCCNLLTKKRSYLVLLFVLSFLVYSFQSIFSPFPSIISFLNRICVLGGFNSEVLFLWCTAFGAALFIYVIILSNQIQKILSFKFFVYIGKISYGIYLVHWLVLYYILNYFTFFVQECNIVTKYLFANIFVFVLTIALSSMTYYMIELPFIRFGKTLLQKLNY